MPGCHLAAATHSQLIGLQKPLRHVYATWHTKGGSHMLFKHAVPAHRHSTGFQHIPLQHSCFEACQRMSPVTLVNISRRVASEATQHTATACAAGATAPALYPGTCTDASGFVQRRRCTLPSLLLPDPTTAAAAAGCAACAPAAAAAGPV